MRIRALGFGPVGTQAVRSRPVGFRRWDPPDAGSRHAGPRTLLPRTPDSRTPACGAPARNTPPRKTPVRRTLTRSPRTRPGVSRRGRPRRARRTRTPTNTAKKRSRHSCRGASTDLPGTLTRHRVSPGTPQEQPRYHLVSPISPTSPLTSALPFVIMASVVGRTTTADAASIERAWGVRAGWAARAAPGGRDWMGGARGRDRRGSPSPRDRTGPVWGLAGRGPGVWYGSRTHVPQTEVT